MSDGLMTAQQVAEYLGLSKSWVRQKTRLGEIPAIHIGGAVRYSPKAIERWLESFSNADEHLIGEIEKK